MGPLDSNSAEETLNKIIKEFAQAISESPEFLSFEEARKKLKEDQQAQRLIKEFEDKQQFFQMLGNSLDSKGQAEWIKYQQKLCDHPLIHDYFQKLDDLTRFFQDLGKLISEVAGFDFNQACAPPTGCC